MRGNYNMQHDFQRLLRAVVCMGVANISVAASADSFEYAPPTAGQVKQVMDRVRGRLEANAPLRLVDRKSGEEIKNYSKVNPDAELDHGPEGKFPPIAYPMGVICSGMLSAAEATGDGKYADFVVKRYQFFADHYKDFQAWPMNRDNPFRNFYSPVNLDSCGAMAAAMVKARRMNVGADLAPIIETQIAFIHGKQQRLEDGTFCRPSPFPQSIWLDDAYMSVPLLAEYGAMTGKREYFDDAVNQIKGFYKHLFIPERGLFTHAATEANEANHPIHCWGRANGWFMVATVELLDLLPEDHPDRGKLIEILQTQARGIASCQSGSGLWHQILDKDDSYLETSCSAMFCYALAKGVNRGWLDASSYGPVAVAGWNGVATKIDAEGRVNDVCIGTNYADDMAYYYRRPATDDMHGYGPALLAGSEMIRLLKNPKFSWEMGPGRATLIKQAKK